MSVQAILIYIGIPVIGALYLLAGFSWIYFIRAQNHLEDRCDGLSKELYEFRIYCASQYSTMLFTKDVEERMMSSLVRLEAKLDKLLDRIIDHH